MRKTGFWRRTDLVKKVAARRNHWPDADSMKADLMQKNLYKNWHPDALQAFIDNGTKASADGGIELSCAPEWEASIFGLNQGGSCKPSLKVKCLVGSLVASKPMGLFLGSAVKPQR